MQKTLLYIKRSFRPKAHFPKQRYTIRIIPGACWCKVLAFSVRNWGPCKPEITRDLLELHRFPSQSRAKSAKQRPRASHNGTLTQSSRPTRHGLETDETHRLEDARNVVQDRKLPLVSALQTER